MQTVDDSPERCAQLGARHAVGQHRHRLAHRIQIRHRAVQFAQRLRTVLAHARLAPRAHFTDRRLQSLDGHGCHIDAPLLLGHRAIDPHQLEPRLEPALDETGDRGALFAA